MILDLTHYVIQRFELRYGPRMKGRHDGRR